MENNRNLNCIIARKVNTCAMALSLFISLIALSVGLSFYYLVDGDVGGYVGIAMFIIAGIVFVLGELCYLITAGQIKRNSRDGL